MNPGMMPILHSSGVMMPGQLGPIRRQSYLFQYGLDATMSRTGTPSVMQTISPTPASAASRIASAANGAGTKIMLTSHRVSATAWRTVS